VDEIRRLAQQSLQIFEQFVAGARSLMTEEGLSAAGAMEKIKEQRERLVTETKGVLRAFRTKVTEKEQELKAVVYPERQDLIEQARAAIREIYQIIEHLSLKDKMLHRWVEQSASALVADYQEAIAAGDIAKVEVFESEAEKYLAEKGDLEATSRFLTLRAASEESRMSAEQKKAKATLTELERIKEQVAVVIALFASGSEVYGGLAPLEWRQEGRIPLDRVDQVGVSASLHRDGHPPLRASLTEISKGGVRVQVSEKLTAGMRLVLALKYPGVTKEAVSLETEVEWCEEERAEPGRCELGLGFVEGATGVWSALFPQIVEQVDAFHALVSSPFNSPPQ
jgi:hypothetical protein